MLDIIKHNWINIVNSLRLCARLVLAPPEGELHEPKAETALGFGLQDVRRLAKAGEIGGWLTMSN